MFPQNIPSVSKASKIDNNFAIHFMNCLFGNIHFQGDLNQNYNLFLRALGKELGAKNSNFLTSLISYINLNLISNDFVKNLIIKEEFSCPLFRLLLTSKCYTNDLVKICQSILEKNSNFDDTKKYSSFLEILKQFLKKQLPEKDPIDKILTGTPTEILEKTDLVSLERTTKYLVEKNIKNSSNEDLVEAMSKILLSDVDKKNFEKTGLFVDWLAELEMEIIGNSPELQVIFNKFKDIFFPIYVMLFHCLLLLAEEVVKHN